MANLYKNSASLYDKVTNEKIGSVDIDFYLNKINKSSKVLELGCGTGRVAIDLAKNGIEVTALDLSSQMLQAFKAKVKGQSFANKIQIIKGDMSSFKIPNEFDWIIFPFRSFQSLTTKEQRNNCLSLVNKHLKKGGKVVIQMFDPIPEILEKWHELHGLDTKLWDSKNEQYIERYSIGEKHLPEKQTVKYHYTFKILDKENKILKEYNEPMELGYLYHNQAKRLFEKHNYQIEKVFSNWDETPYNSELKKEQIFILSKNR